MRERLDLCGLWHMLPDPMAHGEGAGYATQDYDHHEWREVRLPNVFDRLQTGLEAYEGPIWFRRQVVVPASWLGRQVLLCFGAVNYHARVWVNGQPVGGHEDGFLPFCLAVHDAIRFGGANQIAVCADNVRREGEVPGLQRGWRTFGGVLREVELLALDPLHLDYVAVDAVPVSGGGALSARIEVRNERAAAAEMAVSLSLLDGEGQVLWTAQAEPAVVAAGGGQTTVLQGQIEGLAAWHPRRPALYTAQIELLADGETVDRQAVRVGFRRIEAREGKLLLNGQPIFLTGFNRHEDSPQRDMAVDLEMARQDLAAMKEAGANFVRLCHYPHHPGELDLCDELGLLVMGEVPLYWWDGSAEGEANCQAKLAAAERQLRAMIRRDVNHPSLIFWSASNENQEDRPEVAAGIRHLVQAARELDPTRLAVHVSDRWRTAPNFEQDAVICVNSYPTFNARNRPGGEAPDPQAATRFWREGLQALHELYPDKPILISEFGYPSFEGVYDGMFGEPAQAAAIEGEFAGMDAPYVCGATIWCWADHPWPAATFAFCRYLGISPFGVVSRERRRLQAYWTARRLFRTRQGLQDPPQPAAPHLGPAGYSLVMIRPHMRDIPDVPFAEGFGIRPMRLDEGGLWTDIERDAEPYYPIESDLFTSQFGGDLQATQWRSFILTNHKGVGVGTISAWYHADFKGERWGQIHWVAVRPAYQGLGLGKAGLSFALRQMAQWHERCFLGTQSFRLPAIGLYLDFGFLPDLDSPQALEAWREVKRTLHHPVLEGIEAL